MYTLSKRSVAVLCVIGLLLLSLLPLVVSPTVSNAARPNANGDLVHETKFSQECPSATNLPIGVGIAFDGKYLWYSCYNTDSSSSTANDLYKTDPISGTVISSYHIAGGLGALAYDGKRKKLWASWGGGYGNNRGDIRLIDPTTGIGTVMFNAADANINEISDGIAYNFQDDSLYIKADTSQKIWHYSTGGALLDSFPWTGTSCYNSGLAIGGDLLFQGSDGCNHVWVIGRSDHAPAFDFATGADGVRDEGLACDAVTFAPKTVMWSIEAYSPRRAIAYNIPPGSCDTGGGVDTDGDGLLDSWETGGVTIDGGAGPMFIDLPAMGADPNKKDIFIHLDWMQDATHNTKLDPAALKKVVDAFAAQNINMHIDQGPDSIMNYATNATWGALSKAKALPYQASIGTFDASGNYDWTAFQAIKDANFTPTGRTPIFHYVISANRYGNSGSSGISRGIKGSDLIVSLGFVNWPNNAVKIQSQAGTLMHELGHNLGLRHGGSDDTNYKPNYLSIMNYSFQFGGVIKGGVAGTLDYSEQTVDTLNENALVETTGLGPTAAGYGTYRYCPTTNSQVFVGNANTGLDWNCDGVITGTVAVDINKNGAKTNLTGFNDWPNLVFKGGAIGLAGAVPVLPTLTENDPFSYDDYVQQFEQPAGAIGAVAGVSQTTKTNTAFPTPLQVMVTDQSGNPLSNVTIFFSAPLSGASGTFAGGNSGYVTKTNAAGVVIAPTFTANSVQGSYTVTATVGGAPNPAVFNLTNTNVYSYYLPFLGNGANGYTSYLVFQNPTNAVANISLQYYTPQGTLFTSDATCPTLAAFAECIPNNPFGAGDKGGGIILSNQPLNVVVPEGTPYGGSAYAVGSGASQSLIAPLAFHNAYTDFNTQLTVFNTSGGPVSVTVAFYNTDGSPAGSANCELNNIPANGSGVLDQANACSLPNGFNGWAQITGPVGSKLVAQVLEQSASRGFVAIANAQATPQTSLYTPAMFKNAINGFNTGANIINPGSSPVTVTITYYNVNGNTTTTAPFTVAAHSLQTVYQGGGAGVGLPGGNGLADGFNGAAIVNSTGGIIMVVNESGGGNPPHSGVYAASGTASGSVGLPVIANGGYGYVTGLTVFNTSSQPVSGSIQYYTVTGVPQGGSQPFSIGANASYQAFQGTPGLLPNPFYGTAVLTQTGGGNNLVVTTNALSSLFYTYTEPNS